MSQHSPPQMRLPSPDRFRFLVLMGLSAGVLISQFEAIGHVLLMIAAIAFGLLIVLWKSRLSSHNNHQTTTLWITSLAACSICCGMLSYQTERQTQNSSLTSLLKQHSTLVCTLKGRLVSEPTYLRSTDPPALTAGPQLAQTRCVLQCTELVTSEGEVPIKGLVQIKVQGHLLHARPGDTILVTGNLQSFSPPGNPGEFDRSQWAKRNGFCGQLTCNTPQAITVTQKRQWPYWSDLLSRIREGMRLTIRSRFDQQNVPVALTLLLGDRSELSFAEREKFAHAGLIHLLAISGLHVGLVILLLRWLCLMLNTSPRSGLLVILVSVTLYAVLVETRPPIVRAWLMTVLWTTQQWHMRQTSLLGLLCSSGLILFAWSPAIVNDVGAQLSFAGVLGINWGNRVLRDLNTNVISLNQPTLWEILRTHVLQYAFWIIPLTLMVAPLSLLNFQYVSLIGLFLQVPATFCIALSMVFSAMGFLTEPLGAWASVLPFFLANVTLKGTTQLAELGSLPWTYWQFSQPPSLGGLGLWYACLLPLATGWTHSRFLTGKVCLMGMSCMLIYALTIIAFPQQNSAVLSAYFCSVGHGEAIVVAIDEEVIVYDCGSIRGSTTASRSLDQVLRSMQADAIDTLIVSHADVDHYNGVPALLERWPVGRILLSKATALSGDPGMNLLLQQAKARNIPVTPLTHSVQWSSRDQVTCHLWMNPALEELNSPEVFSITDNDQSLVLKVTTPSGALLLTGDLENAGQQQLMRSLMLEDVAILLAPHHGSIRANSLEFWNRISPERMIVSTGNDHSQLTEQLKQMETPATLHSTNQGALKLTYETTGDWRCFQFSPEHQQWVLQSSPQ